MIGMKNSNRKIKKKNLRKNLLKEIKRKKSMLISLAKKHLGLLATSFFA